MKEPKIFSRKETIKGSAAKTDEARGERERMKIERNTITRISEEMF